VCAHARASAHETQGYKRDSAWKQTLEGTEGDAYLCPDQGIIIVRRVGRLDVERRQVRLLLLLAIRRLRFLRLRDHKFDGAMPNAASQDHGTII